MEPISPKKDPAPAAPRHQVQAGFQGADWGSRTLPPGTKITTTPLRTADGASTKGLLYACGAPDTVVVLMHPREFTLNHYLVPDILEAGFAAWSQAPRSVGVDLRLEHEAALLDLASGLTYLRGLGFKRIVLAGNSGGASLHTFYIQQSNVSPEARIARTPAGGRTHLAEADLPQVDGVIYVAPHPGQGKLLMRAIDPSVTDEADPLAISTELDPFDPRNGFASSKDGVTRYTPDFIERYRLAQQRRVEQLDAHARFLISRRRSARKKIDEGATDRESRIIAYHTPVMTVWRTDADLRCFDLSIDPSDRKVGSVWGRNPFASNYGAVGFARFCSPEAWLSTWSGLSSNAAVEKTGSSVEQPVLLIEYTGDQTVFPSDVKQIFGSLPSADKVMRRIRGDHHGRALTPDEEAGRFIAGRQIQLWLREKFA